MGSSETPQQSEAGRTVLHKTNGYLQDRTVFETPEKAQREAEYKQSEAFMYRSCKHTYEVV